MVAPVTDPIVSPVQLAYAITREAPQAERLADGLKHIAELRANKVQFAVEPRTEAQLEISEAALKKEAAILEQFPKVRLLDPAALRLLIDQDLSKGRPPRLAPFQANAVDVDTWIEAKVKSEFRADEKRKMGDAQNTQVSVRTNFHSPEMERVYEDFTHKLVEQAFHCSVVEARNQLQQNNWGVTVEGSATAWAKLGDVTIPEKAKEVINQARASKLFDRVYLLAEAARWDIRHSVAVEAHLPRNVDPLIIGEANGKLWVLDAFDLSAYERHVWEEFCVRP